MLSGVAFVGSQLFCRLKDPLPWFVFDRRFLPCHCSFKKNLPHRHKKLRVSLEFWWAILWLADGRSKDADRFDSTRTSPILDTSL